MYAKSAFILERQGVIADCLTNTTMSVAEVAEHVEISKKRVYTYAKRTGLPYNRPIKPGGRKEQRILAMYGLGHTVGEIGFVFRMSHKFVESVLQSARESQMDNPTGYQGEATTPVSTNDGDA